MSALPAPRFRGRIRFVLPMLRDSAYANDRDYSLSLLAACSEYLGSCAGSKRQIVESEMKALREIYEATWCELGCALPAKLVRRAQAAMERLAS